VNVAGPGTEDVEFGARIDVSFSFTLSGKRNSGRSEVLLDTATEVVLGKGSSVRVVVSHPFVGNGHGRIWNISSEVDSDGQIVTEAGSKCVSSVMVRTDVVEFETTEGTEISEEIETDGLEIVVDGADVVELVHGQELPLEVALFAVVSLEVAVDPVELVVITEVSKGPLAAADTRFSVGSISVVEDGLCFLPPNRPPFRLLQRSLKS
jgi:hypothetical protein